jgi:type IV secretory pathway TrbF-like protein
VHDTRSLYHSISNTYEALNDEKNATEYLQKYTYLNDSLNLADKQAVNVSVDKFMKEKIRKRKV